MSVEDLFCDVDDFCRRFLPVWHRQQLPYQERQRRRGCRLALSEIMTLLIHFHQAHDRHFKADDWLDVGRHWAGALPNRLSYPRWVAVIPAALVPLCVYLHTRKGLMTGIAFIDATSLVVCHHRRIQSQKVFKSVARRGKTSVGWCYGFNLHRVVNARGDLLAFQMTPGHTDDRQPVPRLVKGLTGTLFSDRGSIAQQLFEPRLEQTLQLITQVRKTRRNQRLPVADTVLLRQRALLETLNDPLKNLSQIEHPRHRRGVNAMVNLLAGLVAYTHQPKKPSLDLSQSQLKLLNCQA